MHGVERYRPFFIVGSGRCGSTLLRAMLQAQPNVHIPPENDLRAATRAFRRYSRLPWNAVLRLVLGTFEFHPAWNRWELTLSGVFRELDARPPGRRDLAAVFDAVYRTHMRMHKPSATRWGDKTPLNVHMLPDLRATFPDLLVIHMVRDGRDVVCSLTKLLKNDLEESAALWLEAVHAGAAFVARYPTLALEVRYEDLVADPGSVLQRVTRFLDVPFEERMLRPHELNLHFGDVELFPHMQGVFQPIYRTSVGRWRTAFTPAQLARLDRALGPTLAALGYLDGGAA